MPFIIAWYGQERKQDHKELDTMVKQGGSCLLLAVASVLFTDTCSKKIRHMPI